MGLPWPVKFFLVIPAKAGIQLLRFCPGKAELPLACGERVTFWHCPKSNQKG
jgi:hypothetical protein